MTPLSVAVSTFLDSLFVLSFSIILYAIRRTSLKRYALNEMTKMRKKRTVCFCLATCCLLLGSAIYVLFRPTSLLMFHWIDVVGMTTSIGTIRTWVNGFDKYMPTWIVYSLPFALWVSSYLFFIKGIWLNSTSLIRHAWFWCIPVIVIVTELAQNISIIPGHFDKVDLVTIVLGILFGFVAIDFNQLNKGETE